MMKKLLFAILIGSTVSWALPPISQFGWIAGRWKQTNSRAPMEAQITTASGGLILATWKIVNEANQVDFFEFERIEEKDGNLLLTPYPFGVVGVTFKATELTEAHAVFENAEHEFPSRISYEKLNANTLKVRVEGKDQDGKAMSLEWKLARSFD